MMNLHLWTKMTELTLGCGQHAYRRGLDATRYSEHHLAQRYQFTTLRQSYYDLQRYSTNGHNWETSRC